MAGEGQKVDREVVWGRWAEHGCELKFLSTEVAVEGLEVRITIIICILGGILIMP